MVLGQIYILFIWGGTRKVVLGGKSRNALSAFALKKGPLKGRFEPDPRASRRFLGLFGGPKGQRGTPPKKGFFTGILEVFGQNRVLEKFFFPHSEKGHF